MIETMWIYATQKEYRSTFARPFWHGLQSLCVTSFKASAYARAGLDLCLGKKSPSNLAEVRRADEMTSRALPK
jgi:hypothetical protein